MSCLCDLDMKHIALHLALTFMKISLVVYCKKNVSGADPYLFVKASFCENRLCLLLNKNCFSLSIETLKDIINLI